jgi:hypothetical protein
MRFRPGRSSGTCRRYTGRRGSPLTKIQDTLYKADGTRFEGVARSSGGAFKPRMGPKFSSTRSPSR